jgi:hypothetical protein
MKKMPAAPAPDATDAAASDKESIRTGAGYRLPAAAPANVADPGKIRMGAGYRLPGRATI